MTIVSLPTAFHTLFDDAAIFPPGNAPMRDAVQQHDRYRSSDYAAFVGPFVCSTARLGELADALDAFSELGGRDQHLDVAVVASSDESLPEPSERIRIVAVEQKTHRAEPAAHAPTVPTYLELPELPHDLSALRGTGLRAKFRTGGASPAAFPTVASLAGAILAAVAADVPFKCTAGLHRAVRHTEDEGFEHHGFLNVLLATHAAVCGADRVDVESVLAERDAAALVTSLRVLPDEDVARTRSAFVSFGTCSIEEPVADLRHLGLLT